jgi:hypothetical protein
MERKVYVQKRVQPRKSKEDFVLSIVDLDFVAKLTHEDRLKLATLLQQTYKDAFLNGYNLRKKVE